MLLERVIPVSETPPLLYATILGLDTFMNLRCPRPFAPEAPALWFQVSAPLPALALWRG